MTSLIKDLLSLSEAVKTKTKTSTANKGDELQLEISDLQGKDVEINFRLRQGVFSNYFSSVHLSGKIISVNEAKKSFVFEYDDLRMNDETMSGGPGGTFKSYKTIFSIDDIDSVDDHHGHVSIEMKA